MTHRRQELVNLYTDAVSIAMRGLACPASWADPLQVNSDLDFTQAVPEFTAFDWTLIKAIREVRMCYAKGWPFIHALTAPFQELDVDMPNEFVGVQGGLTYNSMTGEME